jgi:hypothetical protein
MEIELFISHEIKPERQWLGYSPYNRIQMNFSTEHETNTSPLCALGIHLLWLHLALALLALSAVARHEIQNFEI